MENWLVRTFLLCKEWRKDWSWTFYCILGLPGKLDELVKKNGGQIIYSPVTISEKRTFLRHLRSVLLEGRFDIIHSHHDFLSGFYLLASRGIHFRKRILHIHNNDRVVPVGSGLTKSLLIHPLKWLAYRYTDVIVGISNHTVRDFTRGWSLGLLPPASVLYYSVDFSRFSNKPAAIREELNIKRDSRLVLFVGRMNEYKNPLFALEVFNELSKLRIDVHMLFIGRGDLEGELTKRIHAMNLDEKVTLLGWREDIPEIMLSSEVFIFPRLEDPKEGLGLVVVEAQAAGMQLYLTPGIVEDAVIDHEIVHFNSLNAGAASWAKKMNEDLDHTPGLNRNEALKKALNSPFELNKATGRFISLYES